MRRPSRRFLAILALVAAVPLVLVLALWEFANTDSGQRLIEQLATRLSDNRVVITGLSGRLPGELHLDRLELRDGRGVWLVATDITLRSSASRLLLRHVDVDLLRAGHVLVSRAPVANPAAGSGDAGPAFLQRFDVATLELPRLELDRELAGADALLDLRGHVHAIGTREVDTSLFARRLDGPGTYQVVGEIDARRVNAALDVEEPAAGPLQNLAGLPGLGALSAHASVVGPRNAETTRVVLAAGALRANATGTVNWTAGIADVDVTGSAPAMSLSPAISWDGVELNGHFHGRFAAPVMSARLRVLGAHVGATSLRSLAVDVDGDLGAAKATATLEGLRIPGAEPALFAAAPVELDITAKYTDAAWRADFTAAHVLAEVRGWARAGARPQLAFTAKLPAVGVFARLVGIGVEGAATVSVAVAEQDGERRGTLTVGLVGVGGSDAWARLLSPGAMLSASGATRGTTFTLERARLDADGLKLSVSGSDRAGAVDFNWEAELPSLAALSPSLAGTARAHGRIHGRRENFGGEAVVKVDGTAHTAARGVVDLVVEAQGLPDHPSATVDAHGSLDSSPVRIGASLKRAADGEIRALIERATWRSASARGDVSLPSGERPIRGRVSFELPHLDEFERLLGEPVRGSLAGSVDFVTAEGRHRAEVRFEARDAGTPEHRIGHLAVSGHVDAPTTHPVVALHAQGDGLVVATATGAFRVDAAGPEHAVVFNLASTWTNADGALAAVSSVASLDLAARRLRVSALEATVRGQQARLLTPATLAFRDGLSVDTVELGSGSAVLAVAGRLAPALDLTASLTNATPAPLALLYPDWPVDGAVTADAHLTGTFANPEGTARVHGTGLRVRSDAGRAVPATEVVGSVTFHDGSAVADLHVRAGAVADLHVAGSVPARRDQSFALHAEGSLALATANPFLEPRGRRVRGQATINADVTGLATDPKVAGTVTVEHGDFQDFAHGAHLSDVSLTLRAADKSLKLDKLVAHAGPGTVTVEGTIGVLEPSIPVDLSLTAANAQPLTSDLLTARVDGSLTVKGGANTQLESSGRFHIIRAEINIPNALPHDVAVLDVRRPHSKPPPPASWRLAPIKLDLAVDAARGVFVRGRGLDAELGGELLVGGTYDAPEFSGGFDMRRGSLALAGASLTFTSGRVSLNGAGPRNALDPTLDFVAENSSATGTATLTVGGYASAPTVELTSTPEQPQDAILANLLFSTDPKQLGPLQMLSIGVALASISGIGYGSADPLAAVQRRLGLDRLAVAGSSGTDGNAATVEAGRYVSSRVYLGAVQSTTGITKLQAQVDLSKHLKLQTVVGNGSATAQGTTPQNDPGNTVGIVYQIDY